MDRPETLEPTTGEEPAQHLSLSQALCSLRDHALLDKMTVESMLAHLKGRGYGLIILLLSLPFCIPVPLMGLSPPFGCAIIFLSLRMAFGQRPWIPQFILRREIPRRFFEEVVTHGVPLIQRMEKVLHPRFYFLAEHPLSVRFNGMCITLMAFLLLLPIPLPFTNILPALPIVLLALGMMERDGYFILAGYGIAIFASGVFTALFLLGQAGVLAIWHKLFS
jgi:hypothetical protein